MFISSLWITSKKYNNVFYTHFILNVCKYSDIRELQLEICNSYLPEGNLIDTTYYRLYMLLNFSSFKILTHFQTRKVYNMWGF